VANFVQKHALRFLDEDLTKPNGSRSMNVVLFCFKMTECIQSEDFTIVNLEAVCFSETLVPAYCIVMEDHTTD
jgi:hypothetical protein